MNLPFLLKNCFGRIFCRKKTFISLIILFLCSTICGIVFVKTPSVYEYHFNMCERFIDKVCFSSTSVFLIFIERTAGNVLILAFFVIAGIHPAACVLPPVILIYRAYTFGGSLFIFCSVYRFTGVLVAFLLYFPIHIMIDFIFICASTCSFSRSACFGFRKSDLVELLNDFLLFVLIITLICLAEALFLFALFHPLGSIV